jgi:hypothetical protein
VTYQSPTDRNDHKWTGDLFAYATDGAMYGADIRIKFQLTVDGVATPAPDVEGFGDPNFQSFVDHIASWPGFTLPSGSEYTNISSTTLSAEKTHTVAEECQPTP